MLKLSEISYENALALLLLRKQALDSGAIVRLTKEAMAQTHWLTNIGLNYEKKALNEDLQNALIGAGVGAGVGGLGNLAFGNSSKKKLNRLLEGGLAGASLGGGLGAMYNPAQSALSALNGNTKDPAAFDAGKKVLLSKTDGATKNNIQRSVNYAAAHPDDTKRNEEIRTLVEAAQKQDRQSWMDTAAAGGVGLATGVGGAHGVGAMLNSIEKNKKPGEVMGDLTTKLLDGIKTDKGLDVNKFDKLVENYNTAQDAMSKVRGSGKLVPEVSEFMLKDNLNQLNANSNIQKAFNGLKPALKDPGFKEHVVKTLTTDAKTPYSLTKPVFSRPSTAQKGRAGLILGSTSAAYDYINRLRSRADLAHAAIDVAADRPIDARRGRDFNKIDTPSWSNILWGN